MRSVIEVVMLIAIGLVAGLIGSAAVVFGGAPEWAGMTIAFLLGVIAGMIWRFWREGGEER